MDRLDLTPDTLQNNAFPVLSFDDFKNAKYQYKLIIEQIKTFESKLDDSQEVGIKLASFGQSILLQVTDIGYANPYLLYFYGYVDNQPTTLIQHIFNLNFLLTAIKRNPSKPKRTIGFISD